MRECFLIVARNGDAALNDSMLALSIGLPRRLYRECSTSDRPWSILRASSIESLGTSFEPLQTTIDLHVRIRLDQPINNLCDLIVASTAIGTTNQPQKL